MEYNKRIGPGTNTLYAEQLKRGFGRLRFIDFLEQEFRRSYLQENYQKSRLIIGFSLAVCILVTILTGPIGKYGEAVMLAIGLLMMAPMLVVTLIVSFTRQSTLYQILLGISALVIGMAGTAVDLQASHAGMSYYFAGQIGWILMIWLMLGFQFRVAARLALFISVAYVIAAMIAELPPEEIVFEACMLLTVNLLGAYSCYRIEYAARRTFLESKMLSELAERDGLTGLYNRRTFDEYVERVWRQSRREDQQITFLLIDIDNFKAFNDRYGHQAGDDALKDVATVIAGGVQRPLDLAARYGGEEFALILYGPASDYGYELPERLRRDIESMDIASDHSTEARKLTVSIGVAILYPGAERSLAGAIQMADEALYQAKEEGRNRVVVEESGSSKIETGRFRIRRAG